MDSGSDGPVLRGATDKDGNQVFSLFDLGNIAGKRGCENQYGKNIFYRLMKDGSKFKDEVSSFCIYLKFPGSGQKESPCAGIRGLQRYLMLLGGKVAAEYREIIEGTFTRVMAGDQSLIEVINANAASQEPVQLAYRAALAQEPVAPVLDDFCLKRKRDREDRLFDMEMAERQIALEGSQLRLETDRLALENGKLEHQGSQLRLETDRLALDNGRLALENGKLEHQAKLIEHVNTSMGSINALKDWANVDERTKLQAEAHIKNVLFNKVGAQSSSADETQAATPLNVSILAKELGFKCSEGQLQRIGRGMAKKYRETYQSDPPKHKQFVGGMYIPVNSYMERDRSMMELVIRSVMAS